VTDMSWNPPAGPPNGDPIAASDARHEVDEAIDTARARDRDLRAALVDAVTARGRAAGRIPAVASEAENARRLAKRALAQSTAAARAGNRDDEAKWTAAAKVFAMRLRDERERAAALERAVADADERIQRVERAITENAGRLQAVAAARVPMVSARRAARLQRAVGETVGAITAPTGDLVARAMEAVQAEAEAEADAASEDHVDGTWPPSPQAQVADLEREVDLDSTADVLDELRAEMGQEGRGRERSGGERSGRERAGDDPAVDRVPAARR
jgi:hypothetical protein